MMQSTARRKMKPCSFVPYCLLLSSICIYFGSRSVVGQATPASVPGQLAIIEPLLVVSTLDGGLFGIGKRSGLVKWTLNEEPIVKLPQLPNATDSLKQPLF